jgi:hypothetical protein
MLSTKVLFIIILIMALSLGCYSSREAYVCAHPELNCNIKEAIIKGEALEGMTPDEVKASWGSPYEIVQSIEGGFYFVYIRGCSKGTFEHSIVVFDKNGKVVSSGPR